MTQSGCITQIPLLAFMKIVEPGPPAWSEFFHSALQSACIFSIYWHGHMASWPRSFWM